MVKAKKHAAPAESSSSIVELENGIHIDMALCDDEPLRKEDYPRVRFGKRWLHVTGCEYVRDGGGWIVVYTPVDWHDVAPECMWNDPIAPIDSSGVDEQFLEVAGTYKYLNPALGNQGFVSKIRSLTRKVFPLATSHRKPKRGDSSSPKERKSILREQIAKYKKQGLTLAEAKPKAFAWHAAKYPFNDPKYRNRKSTDLACEREYKRENKREKKSRT
jgi:hypothetical protein